MNDVVEQVEKFRDFLEQNYQNQLNEITLKGRNFLLIDFSNLLKYDHELADQLLDEPEETIKAFELTLDNFEISHFVRIRFHNLPLNQKVKIKDIRSQDLGKFLLTEGIVRQSSDVRPQVVSAKFECPSCGNSISILQVDVKFKEPYRCTCGKKGRFRLLSKELVDAQRIVIEESPDSLEGGEQPKRLNVFLKEDLVEPIMEKKTTPGSKVRVNGIIKEIPVLLKSGSPSTKYDIMMEANFIEPLEETFEELDVNKEDEEKIIELAKNPKIYEKFVNSIAPSIYGHSDIKEALALQLFGGVRKERKDGTWNRGDIHILLVGDPGSSKSSLLFFMSKVAPKARYVSGKSSSAAGLCVAPDSLVLKNPGSLIKIKDEVEERLKLDSSKYSDGIWKTKDGFNQKVYTLDNNFKVKSGQVESFWKIKAPEEMVSLKLQSGKEITLTKNTKLLTINNGKIDWLESNKFIKNNYIATVNNLNVKSDLSIPTLSLVTRNPVIYGVKPFLKEILSKVNKRELAKELKINENNLYHNWIKESARGNITLKDLRKLLNKFNLKEDKIIDYITNLSLYRAYKFKIPKYLNEDFLYLTGLIAGDGDLSENKRKDSVKIRLSNSNKVIRDNFKKIVKNLFNVKAGRSSKKSAQRSESIGFSNIIISEIINKLCIPKSHKIDMGSLLLNLPNNLVANFVAGYFDCEGSPVYRDKKEGSSILEISSTSKTILKKLQIVLLRWGILSTLRGKRAKGKISKHTNSKIIVSKHDKDILTIYGKDNFIKFRDNIPIRQPDKKKELDFIIRKINKYDTNTDIVPNISSLIKTIRKKLKLNLKSLKIRRNNYSKNYLKKIVNEIESITSETCNEFSYLKTLSEANIFWDKIREIKVIKPDYEYVYDLTVKESHNFLVNGVVVHNTASVVKDEFLKGWALEAGALALANNGSIYIDELDKMDEEDTSALHEGLEQQQISFSKANIQATLLTRTSALAAANPKLGRFDPYQPIAAQINLPPALINRFDLIFPMRDIPDEQIDTKIATHILEVHENKDGGFIPDIDSKLIKKYVSYAKKRVFPKLTEGAKDEIRNFYVSLRNSGSGDKNEVKPIPISARQLEALIRLSEASARVRLSNKITKDDSRRAIRILKKCLEKVGIDPETGKIDIDRITTGITTSQRGKIIIVREVINEFNRNGIKTIPVEDIINACKDKGLEESRIENIIDQMKKEGEIFQPKVGFISKI